MPNRINPESLKRQKLYDKRVLKIDSFLEKIIREDFPDRNIQISHNATSKMGYKDFPDDVNVQFNLKPGENIDSLAGTNDTLSKIFGDFVLGPATASRETGTVAVLTIRGSDAHLAKVIDRYEKEHGKGQQGTMRG